VTRPRRTLNGAHDGAREAERGIAAIETLLAAPVVLLLGLSALQWALVFHGHQAVSHAAIEGARAGSLDHAYAAAVERGLARGLAPWLFGSSGPDDHAASIARTQAELARGKAAGWASWRLLSPTTQSYEDWAVTARDADGEPIPGVLEIPNDNLTVSSSGLLPASGVAGYRDTEPIGAASAQTLADANILKIEFTYGVPLTVPLIGRVAAWLMRAIDGCPESAVSMRLGTVDLGTPQPSTNPRSWACAHYAATDDAGRARPRRRPRASPLAGARVRHRAHAKPRQGPRCRPCPQPRSAPGRSPRPRRGRRTVVVQPGSAGRSEPRWRRPDGGRQRGPGTGVPEDRGGPADGAAGDVRRAVTVATAMPSRVREANGWQRAHVRIRTCGHARWDKCGPHARAGIRVERWNDRRYAVPVRALHGLLPMRWYPRRMRASERERLTWRLIGQGSGVHWNKIHEDGALEGLLAGRPSL